MRRKIWLTSLVNRLAVDSSNYQILLVCLEAEVFNDQGLVNSLKTNRRLHWKPGASKNRVQAQEKSLEAKGIHIKDQAESLEAKGHVIAGQEEPI